MTEHQEYEINALKNNTFDFVSLGETLKELRESSFNFLYSLQRDSVGIKRFDFTFADLKMLDMNHYSLKIATDFIRPDAKLKYRSSNLYRKEITRNMISENKDIFTYSFITIINGKNSNFWKIKIDDHGTEFILPIRSNVIKDGITWSNFKALKDIEANITILVVPNDSFNELYSSLNDLTTFRDFFDVLDIGTEESYFQIPLGAMPVPVECLIPMKFGNNTIAFDHNCDIELYYPNIYHIKNSHNYDMKIFIFYREDTNTLYRMHNEIDLFHRYTDNILSLYKDNSIPNFIKNYTPIELEYGIEDYMKNFYSQKTELEYKSEKLKEWIRENNEFVTPYLAKLMANEHRHYMHLSDIDLSERLRRDTFSEIQEGVNRITFIEDMYVFKFSILTYTPDMILRIFIDGEFFEPDEVYSDEFYTYLYIPTRCVKEDSVIEIERSIPYNLVVPVTFTEEEPTKQIKVKSNEFAIYANDIFLTYENDKSYIDDESFKIISHVSDLDIEIDKGSFFNVTDAKVILTDTELYNIPLEIRIHHTGKLHGVNAKGTLDFVLFRNTMKRCKEQIRLFKNGRLIPATRYTVTFGFALDEANMVTLLNEFAAGDRICVDCTPNKYNEIMYEKEIDERGYIDLSGKLDKPIDTRWFDVYVNGKKIPSTDIEVLTPTKFFINNLKSRKNLDIYERNRDDEYFSIGDSSISEQILANIEGFFDRIYQNHSKIEDIEDDILGSAIENIQTDIITFYYMVLTHMFINPDLDQVTNGMRRAYPTIIEDGKPFFINPDDMPDAMLVLSLNADDGDLTAE